MYTTTQIQNMILLHMLCIHLYLCHILNQLRISSNRFCLSLVRLTFQDFHRYHMMTNQIPKILSHLGKPCTQRIVKNQHLDYTFQEHMPRIHGSLQSILFLFQICQQCNRGRLRVVSPGLVGVRNPDSSVQLDTTRKMQHAMFL